MTRDEITAHPQFRTPVLTVSGGGGFAFVGGTVYDFIDDPTDPTWPPRRIYFPTLQAAGAAYRAAIRAGDELMRIVSHA